MMETTQRGMTPWRIFMAGLFTVLAAVWSLAAHAEEPKGRVLLEITGAITNGGEDGVKRYDLAALEALDQFDLITDTPWTDGQARFTGVLMRDLLKDAGAQGNVVFATALNDYTVTIPVQDFYDYSVVLAYKKDGEYLSVRDRGPLWVMYPWTSVTALQNELFYSRSIWQLRKIEVREN